MKKTFGILTSMIVMLLISTTNVYAATTIDTSSSSNGYVTVTAEKDMVVQITKDTEKYNYTLTNANATRLPLQLGDGSYKILVLKKVSSNQYTAAATETIDATIKGNSTYLNSIQLVNFDDKMVSINDLTTLVSTATTEYGKIEELYDYVIESFSYDYNKASALANSSNYLPVIDDTYVTEKGICYDMSSLFAAVLRYNNIPTKLVMGYTPNVDTYHAWNEVYYDGKWHVMDVTYDVGAAKAKMETVMIKPDSEYSATKLY